jgi:transcriptional/translational regulatory protein YebC/TACO1
VAGHSHWAGIQHKKRRADAERGTRFTKLSRAIAVAAREGGGDPDGNPALALAIQKARDASMPKQNIEAVTYEGYGQGGVAILVEALTDNRNRTSSELRHLFTKHGGNIGEPGSVAWTFEKKGELVVDRHRHSEDDLLVAIDAGAEDVAVTGNVWEIVTAPRDLDAVRERLAAEGVEIESARLVQRPITRTPVDEAQAAALTPLVDALEEHVDVHGVHTNPGVAFESLGPASVA